MCLLLGASGVGKTLLLKKLQAIHSSADKENEEVPATIPTVGTNLVNLSIGRKSELTVRELGGCMGPIWFNYLKDCSCLMYMVDLSNSLQISGSCIQLLTVLSNQSLGDVPVLLIFNKIDMPTIMTRSEVESLFRLDEIISHSKQKVTVIEISAFSGQGLQTIVDWLLQNYNAK
ncbi:hypothetical protein CHS0354_014240 [Potamilus streckersoni]|uniref:ADP-ribosylation factor-like protein 16 n=1 Tax=Potamilus streckersoni TaxID=2493646 RepID=A0AAE0SBA4_9BIVA|nr:hypothetical protein CHS0354_014240 [Potamilus streckersoni]